MIRQTVLAFKLETTQDTITSHAGLALLGEFCVGLDLQGVVDRNLPKPGSAAGYKASEYVFSLVLMLNGGVAWRICERYAPTPVCGRYCR